MNGFYHASARGAQRAPFLLFDGIPDLARPLLPCPPAEWLTAADLADLPAAGEELVRWAPFARTAQFLLPGDLILCGDCTSSLDVASFLALPEWVSVLALSQRSGRGQLRRGWHSPPGNIYAAVRVPFQGAFSAWNAALIVGWMLAQAFRDLGYPLFLKWPNDLVLCREGRWGKVGGILLEERGRALLAGVGINISSAPKAGDMRPGATIDAVVLDPEQPGLPFLGLWADLVKRGKSWYKNRFPSIALESDLRGAEALLAWKGCSVAVSEAAVFGNDSGPSPQELFGRILGLDANGCLRLETDSGEVAVMSGSVRRF